MITITPNIAIDERDITERFIHASGPGGQNVNKVATAVQLRFDAANAAALSDDMRGRLKRLAGRRMSSDGAVVITARRFRSQERNRQDALERLVALIRRAVVKPVRRKPTRPSLASKRRRREDKGRRAKTKRLRTKPAIED